MTPYKILELNKAKKFYEGNPQKKTCAIDEALEGF